MTFVFWECQMETDSDFHPQCNSCHTQFSDEWMPTILVRRENGIYHSLCEDCSKVLLKWARQAAVLGL